MKLDISPEDHLCTWLIPNGAGGVRRVPGSVNLEGDRPPTGIAYGPDLLPSDEGPRQEGPVNFNIPEELRLPSLRAEMSNNSSLILLDVSVEMFLPTWARITAAAAMVGTGELAEQDGIRQIRVQATSLDAISGMAPIGQQMIPIAHDADAEYVFRRNSQAECIWDGAGVKLTLSYDAVARLGDPFEYRFTFNPVLKIELDEPEKLLTTVRAWLDPLRHILELSTGQPEHLTIVKVSGLPSAGPSDWWQVFGTGISQEPFTSDWETVRKARAALQLAKDGDDLLSLIRAWVRLENELHPFAETFAKDIRWLKGQPPRSQVLTLCQAIEGAYDRAHEEENRQRQERRDVMRARVLEAIKYSSILKGKDWQFVKDGIPRRAPSSLNDALRWTSANVNETLAREAALLPIVTSNIPDQDDADWADGVREVRNGMSHGSRTFSRDELHPLASLLTRQARAHSLALLGASAAAVGRAAAPPLE